MRLQLLSVGKPRATALATATRDYITRAQRYGALDWTTVASEDVAPRASAADVEVALGKEAGRILAKLPAPALVVTLDRQGQAWTSLELAKALGEWQQHERHVALVVGSAFGLHGRVLERARLRLSLSRLTLPHELALLVVAEQLYRAHTILRGEPYHK
ncbi:MAG: 23S rRNA (pseudouridine(1915)-N(3))-methyltransferase RlmH [Planctomycetota bacterium]